MSAIVRAAQAERCVVIRYNDNNGAEKKQASEHKRVENNLLRQSQISSCSVRDVDWARV